MKMKKQCVNTERGKERVRAQHLEAEGKVVL
jgi:hypothetical protein